MTSATVDTCRGELLGQSRRAALTDAGRLALDAHLAGCASCRLSRDVLADFDQVDVVDIRDGARIQALVATARARGTVRGRVHARSRLRVAAAAAALIVCGGSASAAVWLWRRPAAPAVNAGGGAIVIARPRPVAHAPIARVEPPAVVAPATGVETPVRTPVLRHRSIARTSAAPVETTPLSAGALLAEAGRARGEGQLDRAVALYRRLQREFPATPEAHVSAVPLGRLLLDGGAARAALAAFDGYLRDVPRGPLVAEALYGRGRALEALGDRDDERSTWERLVTDHGGSAYAPHARRRLAALR
ncbi:MAG TPA: tetratricopeptide repeat protein [Polyangia bacterium]|nr:tetratricopeptide repeat protein [Polyangia bacterium]